MPLHASHGTFKNHSLIAESTLFKQREQHTSKECKVSLAALVTFKDPLHLTLTGKTVGMKTVPFMFDH